MSEVAALLAEGAAALARAGIERPRFEARLLLEAATGRGREWLLARPDAPVAAGDEERHRRWVARRAGREPMAYILGRAEFRSLRFAVGPGVLVPRPDSETLIEAVIRKFPDRTRPWRILDLGVGSGCLLLSLLHHFVNARGVGIDSSPKALAYARANAEALGVDARADLGLGDWAVDLVGRFDIVVANPPYIPSGEIGSLQPEVGRHEPREALDGGPDGLDACRAILPALPHVLDPDGSAFLEIGAGQEASVVALAARHVGGRQAHRDLAGIARCIELWPKTG